MQENKNYTILIVDDVARNIQVVANTLSPKGYKLLFSQSPIKALEIVKGKQIDLILLDIMMPEMDGFNVCKEIKEIPDKKDIPIIFLTAKNDIDSITRGFQMGGVDYIIKPFNNDELQARVDTHIKLRNAVKVIQQQNDELKQLNDTKDKFFSIIAHDLRNPFNAIYMMSEVLQRQKDEFKTDEAKQIVELMHLSTKEIYELLDNLLTWSRLHQKKLEFVAEKMNILKIVNANFSLYESIAKSKGIELKNNIISNLYYIGDRNMLNTIIRNLLTNAIKFTNDGGEIIIDAIDTGDHVQFSVKDNGIGMTKEDIEKIMHDENLNSKKGTAEEKGTGIGLILCKEFVKIHHGELWVESIRNKGTTFYFKLKKDF